MTRHVHAVLSASDTTLQCETWQCILPTPAQLFVGLMLLLSFLKGWCWLFGVVQHVLL